MQYDDRSHEFFLLAKDMIECKKLHLKNSRPRTRTWPRSVPLNKQNVTYWQNSEERAGQHLYRTALTYFEEAEGYFQSDKYYEDLALDLAAAEEAEAGDADEQDDEDDEEYEDEGEDDDDEEENDEEMEEEPEEGTVNEDDADHVGGEAEVQNMEESSEEDEDKEEDYEE